jgi:ABC-type protease/lipase transport system fused ATPase/permease subunit
LLAEIGIDALAICWAVVDKLLVLQGGRVHYFGSREGWIKQLERVGSKPQANLERAEV